MHQKDGSLFHAEFFLASQGKNLKLQIWNAKMGNFDSNIQRVTNAFSTFYSVISYAPDIEKYRNS